jgi:Tfp pilus assembly protein PilX
MTRRHGDDSGATLIIVLFVVTVVAVVIGALAGSADTSERATVGLRSATANTYTADAAGQIAVNTLRAGSWNNVAGTSCFGTSSTLPLNNVFPATSGGAKSSAFVSCTGAQGAVVISSANKPGNAVLTLSTFAGENGQDYGQAAGSAVNIRGGVVSNSNINVKSTLNVTGGAAVNAVTGCVGTISPGCGAIAAPGLTDPVLDRAPAQPAPGLVVPPTPMPTCQKNKVAEFYPGLYTSAAVLNACDATGALMHFNPRSATVNGTYFFDFQDLGTHVWSVSNAEVIGGTPTATLNGASPPAIPGACVNPITSTTAVGVTFAFGGDSRLFLTKTGNNAAQFEICATYSASSIPTVFYGLKSTITNGANVAHAESGCVVVAGDCGGDGVISDGGNGNNKLHFFFEGFVYTPLSSVTLAVNNATQPFFNFGMIARHLQLTSTGSASGAAYISLPDNSFGFGVADTIADLVVYVCPGAATCDATGRVKLRARILINDGANALPVAGNRQMTILSWALS